MKYTLSQIAAWIEAEIEGDSTLEIETLSRIEEGKPGSITFLANAKYTPYIYSTEASAVIVSRDFVPERPVSATLLRVNDPYSAFTLLLEKGQTQQKQSGISEYAFVDPAAKIGVDVYIGAFSFVSAGAEIADGAQIHPQVFIGPNCKVGPQTILHPQVKIYHDCEVGANCLIHAGTTIGSDGFGFAPQADGSFKKIPQTGNVVIEDEVEIGANSCIDRATIGSTVIRRGAKLDNLVQIAHNVEVGAHSVIAAQAGIAGSTKLGQTCMIGGQVGIVGHLQIADQTQIDAQSGVNRNIKKPGQAFRGSPIQPFRQQLKSEVLFRRLTEMDQKITALEKALSKRQ
jgi:UDP-3-O-[3-hydroxymyristoyl] glucosamine N-acyltransferase